MGVENFGFRTYGLDFLFNPFKFSFRILSSGLTEFFSKNFQVKEKPLRCPDSGKDKLLGCDVSFFVFEISIKKTWI